MSWLNRKRQAHEIYVAAINGGHGGKMARRLGYQPGNGRGGGGRRNETQWCGSSRPAYLQCGNREAAKASAASAWRHLKIETSRWRIGVNASAAAAEGGVKAGGYLQNGGQYSGSAIHRRNKMHGIAGCRDAGWPG